MGNINCPLRLFMVGPGTVRHLQPLHLKTQAFAAEKAECRSTQLSRPGPAQRKIHCSFGLWICPTAPPTCKRQRVHACARLCSGRGTICFSGCFGRHWASSLPSPHDCLRVFCCSGALVTRLQNPSMPPTMSFELFT